MVMGITDIDDKIIRRSHEQNLKDFRELAGFYEREFYQDMQHLNASILCFFKCILMILMIC